MKNCEDCNQPLDEHKTCDQCYNYLCDDEDCKLIDRMMHEYDDEFFRICNGCEEENSIGSKLFNHFGKAMNPNQGGE